MDFNPDIFGSAYGPGFRNAKAKLRQFELFEKNGSKPLRQGFNKLELAFGHELEGSLGKAFVIQSCFNGVFCRSPAGIRGHLKIDPHLLLDFALPIVDADDAGDFETFEKNFIFHRNSHGLSCLRERERKPSWDRASKANRV